MPRKAFSVILGGGRGMRLQPLTDARAKPAVPFAGQYRLVDIPISNSLHAGIDEIYVLTQYLSASLNRHVAQTYRFDAFSKGQVTVLAAEQTPRGGLAADWYAGTADAVRKTLHRFHAQPDDDIVILSGDQVYSMDLADFLACHRQQNADVTVAATRCTSEEASRYGVMRVDDAGMISEFAEKPKDPETIKRFAAPDAQGAKTHLASMGIYAFRFGVLRDLLRMDERTDFGKHILPTALKRCRLAAYPFEGFWEDVGTIASYHQVNIALTEPVPAFNLFSESDVIFTRARFLPPAKIGDATVSRALVSNGAIIGDGAVVKQSIIGIRMVIAPRCHLERVVANGAGEYDFARTAGSIPLGVGEGSVLRDVILDRDVRLGREVKLVNANGLREYDDDFITMRDGVIAVGARTVIPDGYSF